MEGPRSKKYLKSHGGPSLSKLSPSASSNQALVRTHSRFSNHSNFIAPSRHSSTSKKFNLLNLPIHPKHSSKLSSPKRSHSGGDNEDRPCKQQKLQSVPALTGLEECGILAELSEKAPATEITTADLESYNRRAKAASYTQSIRKRRALSNRIRSDWKRMPSSAQKGMANLTGALCYRHSLLQALLHSPKFVNWLWNFHQPKDCVEDDPEDCVACKLRDLIQAYWTGRSSDLTNALVEVNKVFKTNNWRVGSDNGQGDPEEHFTWMTRVMSEKLPREVYNLFEAFHCLVTDSFVICDHCGHVSKTDGHVTGPVSVPLKPRIPNGDLSSYLQKYMKEIVTGYRCEKCKDTKDKRRIHQITHSPDVLLIQLKRFDWSGRKDPVAIPFKADLDLNRYRADTNKDNSKYELSAVVMHRGSSGSGHYRCLAKGDDDCWNDFDDAHVSRVKSTTVLDPGKGSGSAWTPYLLFFQRQRK